MTKNRLDLENVNGQLTAWKYVNRKTDHGFDFYLRNMRNPFRGVALSFDEGCIQNCFRKQLVEITGNGRPEVADNMEVSFKPTDWEGLMNTLLEWLFKYVNDSAGHRLVDPTMAFDSSEDSFRASIASQLTDQIRSLTEANVLQLADNNTEYFSGSLLLLSSESEFYELRLGAYF